MIDGNVSFTARYRRPLRWITARGLIRATGSALALEWHDHVLRTDIARRVRGPVQSVVLPLDALDGLEVRRGLLGGTRLVLRARSLDALAALPFASGAECTLRLARADAVRARELSASVHETIAETRLRRLEAAAAADFDARTG
ncbi:MAG TPA: hypothetical protein VFH27_16360 [Longimicrobiaceae bacterium]|nr:hypothetical protein [Longimicrobiaceae bacterium]